MAAVVPDALAQGALHRVPTVTRLVKIFTTLEYELSAAVRAGDAAAVDRMVTDDFELRSSVLPGVPTPRAEWLAQSKGKDTGEIEQMAVHDYGPVAVVSYAWKWQPRRDLLAVDVWVKSGDSWKLSVRYAGPAGDSTTAVPGAVLEAPVIQKKM